MRPDARPSSILRADEHTTIQTAPEMYISGGTMFPCCLDPNHLKRVVKGVPSDRTVLRCERCGRRHITLKPDPMRMLTG